MNFEKINTTETTVQLDKQSLSTTANCTIVPDDKQIDLLLLDKRHLLSPEFNAWYCKWIKSYGVEAFHRLASRAEQEGKNKPRYFSWLLKNHE